MSALPSHSETVREAVELLRDVGCADYVNPPTAEAMQRVAGELETIEPEASKARYLRRRHRDEVWALQDRLALMREALGEIVATKNTVIDHGDGDRGIALDAEGKMRAIAARALVGDVPA